MILPIVRYGHPVLRQKGARVDSLTPEVRQLVTDMLDTMYDAHGVGLAAQQVNRALQITVLDIRGIKDRPSSLWLGGEPADPETVMPLVLINPEVIPVADPVTGAEGCLSFPEIYADITRPEAVEVRATGVDGRALNFRCGGLLAKAIQHEVDHLNGILFKDRMSRAVLAELKDELDALMEETKSDLESPAPRRVRKPSPERERG